MQNDCIPFMQRRPSVFDLGPTLLNVIQMFYIHWEVPWIMNIYAKSTKIQSGHQKINKLVSTKQSVRADFLY